MIKPPAACAADPALFDATDVLDHQKAASFCRVCTLKTTCLNQLKLATTSALSGPDYAPEGTWAGILLTRRGVHLEVAS